MMMVMMMIAVLDRYFRLRGMKTLVVSNQLVVDCRLCEMQMTCCRNVVLCCIMCWSVQGPFKLSITVLEGKHRVF